jgi:hypothetical protein
MLTGCIQMLPSLRCTGQAKCSQETAIFILAAMKISNPAKLLPDY